MRLKQKIAVNLLRHWQPAQTLAVCVAHVGTVAATLGISVQAKKHASILVAWTHELEQFT